MDFILFILGCIFIWLGGNFVVDSATHIARRFSISELIIGLTLVSIGTSLPEVVVNIIASLKKETTVVLGNILGSNISNTLLIIGLTGLICPLVIPKSRLIKESLYYVVCLLSIFGLLLLTSTNQLSYLNGLLLIGLFLGALFIFFKSNPPESSSKEQHTFPSLIKTLSFFVVGCALLPYGGHLLVDSAVNIAIFFGISKAFISLFAVALGTSLPELITSIVAARKGNSSMAIGNVVGSNIFNLTLVLGISACIYPVSFNTIFQLDLFIVLVSFLPILFVMLLTKKESFSKQFSILLVLGYICYIVSIFNR